MTASLGASQEEITWVLTSYIVASAIATPLTGWQVDRLGARLLFIFVIGVTLFSGLALLPPLLQYLLGYPVITTGIAKAPRGIGTMLSMIAVGRLMGTVDPRLLVSFGMALTIAAF